MFVAVQAVGPESAILRISIVQKMCAHPYRVVGSVMLCCKETKRDVVIL